MKNIFIKVSCPIICVLSLVYFISCCKESPEPISEEPEIEVPAEDPSITNSTFEKSLSTSWISDGWNKNSGVFKILDGEGVRKSKALELSSNSENDIWVKQILHLEKDKVYRVKVWVKTQNIVNGYGANICIYGTWQRSQGISGTKNWTQLSLLFSTPSDSEDVTIACRLGYWNGTSTGTAYFDNLTLEEVDLYEAKSAHIRVRFNPDDVKVISTESMITWINNLEKAYGAYSELIGEQPWDGRQITILSVEDDPGGWAVAGNPILWHQPHVKSSLLSIARQNDWSFGILHELGHDFSPHIGMELNNNWNWNEEMFANFRMFFAVDSLNIPIRMSGNSYLGDELSRLYKTDAESSYDKTIAAGVAKGHDGLMYTLIRIQKTIGWEPFKKTYRYLYHSTEKPSTNWDKFSLFLDKLSYYSGQDVRATFPNGELDFIENMLK